MTNVWAALLCQQQFMNGMAELLPQTDRWDKLYLTSLSRNDKINFQASLFEIATQFLMRKDHVR